MHDDVISIPLIGRAGKKLDLFAIVDREDEELVCAFPWYAKRYEGGVYAQSRVKDYDGRWQTILMHRVITDAPGGVLVDHRDHDGLNNRKTNLRFATHQQNAFNQRITSSAKLSQFKGVTRNCGRWIAQIRYGGRLTVIGRFGNEADAARAYDRVAMAMFGEFAETNFKD